MCGDGCWGFSLTVLAGQVLVLGVPMRPAETFGGLAVALADEHLAFVVLAWRGRTQESHRRRAFVEVTSI